MNWVKACRNTKETQISIQFNLSGGEINISTGIGFFDHMLTAFALHSGFGLKISVKGDLEVDCHHTVEDTGIVLGQAFFKALGDKSGIARYGSFYVPMDEALAFCSVDVSGRPFVVFNAQFPQEQCGQYDCCMTEEFVRAFAFNAKITMHINSLYGSNSHHINEAVFKAMARALKQAVAPSSGEVSTKGVMD